MALPPKRLPLASIRIAHPCPLPEAGREAEMPRQGDLRPCPACDKQVHNLSALTRTEVDRLLKTHEREGTMGALCIRYETNADGRPVPTACLRARRAPLFTRIALVALVTVAIGSAIYAPLPLRNSDSCAFSPTHARVIPAKPVRHLGGCPPGDPMCE